MTDEAEDVPLLATRAVPAPRQFRLVGGIQSAAIAAFAGFLALIALKSGADAVLGPADDGNLRFAFVWSAALALAAFPVLLALHHRAMIGLRSRTHYLVFPDRVEVRRDAGSSRRAIPLDRTVAVESWAGPLLRPLGLATLILIVEEPAGASGRFRHVFHPLPNVEKHEEMAELIRARMGGARGA